MSILATLHKCGNSLNYNPHIHFVGTRELVNTETGEILKTNFISYKSFRFAWMNAVCKHLVREKILTKKKNLPYKRLTKFLKILFSEARFLMSTGQIFSEF
jgi:hypothetical protein